MQLLWLHSQWKENIKTTWKVILKQAFQDFQGDKGRKVFHKKGARDFEIKIC